MNQAVITRFAPSPTGYLHIGGARTALFNWLYAKANGGKMLLRIEDTDRERSDDRAVAALLDAMRWLGLDWEGDPVSQHARVERHREIANALLENGNAYRCYATREELDRMREKARAEGRNPVYDGTWRDRDPASAPAGAPFVVRLKTPLEGHTIVHDQVQGEVRFSNADLDDFVLLRSDANPTYMLAVVVDDHDMGVSHIIRGDDHLTNAAKQSLIFQAMGWPVPVMAHIPLIHGMDGTKLSKRHGATGAQTYRAMGYLPDALRNHLVRLGWSHGNEEILSTKEMVRLFGFEGMNKSAARFDFAKLDALNAHYMRAMDPEHLLEAMLSILDEIEDGQAIRTALDADHSSWLEAGLPALRERAKTLVELWSAADFILAPRPLNMDEKAASLVAEDGSKQVLRDVIGALEMLERWDHDTIETVLRNLAEEKQLKFGKLAQPVRAALTGKATSPGAFDVLVMLGKTEALARLYDRL